MQPYQKAQSKSCGVQVKTIISIILTLILISVSYVSADGQVTITIDAVTKYTDGTPILEGELRRYKIFLGEILVASLEPTTLEYIDIFPDGTHIFTATAVALIDGKMVESVHSEPITVIIPPPEPDPEPEEKRPKAPMIMFTVKVIN